MPDEMVATNNASAALVEKVVVGGDLSKLSSAERLQYYARICQSLGLNPLTQPFAYIWLNGKLTLYARAGCADQLRDLKDISITKLERVEQDGIYQVIAYAERGLIGLRRIDSALGAVSVEGLKGEAKANALMKCETKAKRRVTLSICGLGMLDESEVGRGFRLDDATTASGVTEAIPATVDLATGEITEPPAPSAPEPELPGLPAEDQRSILLGQVKGAADKLGLKGPKRAELWRAACGEATEANVDPAALHDLLKSIHALGKAAKG